MSYIILPTTALPSICRVSDLFSETSGEPLSFAREPRLATCVVFGKPHQIINHHPNVLAFYNGSTERLAVDDLLAFARDLSGKGSIGRHGDGAKSCYAADWVLSNIPPEEKLSFLKRAFAKLSGRDTIQYFSLEDRPILDDFLDNVMSIDASKVCLPRPLISAP